MGALESPKTYRGYNSESKPIVANTGRDANQEINPAEVKAAIENVKKVFAEQMEIVAKALMKVATDTEDAVIVQGTSMAPVIEDTARQIRELDSKVTAGIDDLYEYACAAHDEIQKENNRAAYNACRVTGVVSIS